MPTKHYALAQTLQEIVPQACAAEFLLLTQNWRGTQEIDSILPAPRYVYGDAKAGGTLAEGTLFATLLAIDSWSAGRRTYAARKEGRGSICRSRYASPTSFGHVALPVNPICAAEPTLRSFKIASKLSA